MKKIHTYFSNENGMTLVEILASLVILSIVVTGFLAFFTQGARTNQMTTEVNEATYIAQAEMERVTALAETGELGTDYAADSYDTYDVTTTVNKENDMFNATVIVKEGEQTRAQMETWLPVNEASTE